MRTDTVFEVNNIDFSMYIPVGSYKVGDTPLYKSWNDANGREHREVYLKHLQGSFDMIFNTMEAFNSFNEAYKTVRAESGLTPAMLMNNSTNNLEQKNVYLSFSPIRNRHDDWTDYYERFTVDVKEW